jgi:hypothetical protein
VGTVAGRPVNTFPQALDLRNSLRAAALEEQTVLGVHKGLHFGQSIRCEKGDHYDWATENGCRNDGTNCLCQCHDQGRRDGAG